VFFTRGEGVFKESFEGSSLFEIAMEREEWIAVLKVLVRQQGLLRGP
jgi:hypothetical protein